MKGVMRYCQGTELATQDIMQLLRLLRAQGNMVLFSSLPRVNAAPSAATLCVCLDKMRQSE